MSAETWMRVVVYEQKGAASDGSLKKELEGFIRLLQHQKGYQIGFAGEDPDDGALATVTQWSSLAAIEAADAALASLVEEAETRGVHMIDRQNIQLFTPAPSMKMWSNNEATAEEEKPKHKHRFHLRH
jgi:hypothetical protein